MQSEASAILRIIRMHLSASDDNTGNAEQVHDSKADEGKKVYEMKGNGRGSEKGVGP